MHDMICISTTTHLCSNEVVIVIMYGMTHNSGATLNERENNNIDLI